MERKTVVLKDIYIDKYDFDGEIDTIIANLTNLKEAGVELIDIDVDYDHRIEVTALRYETGEELFEREKLETQKLEALKIEEEHKQMLANQKEYAQYMKLKEKFEK